MGHRLGEGRDVVGETVVGVGQPRVHVGDPVVGLGGEVEAVGVGHQPRTKRQGQLGLQVSENNYSILDESRTGPPCHLSGIFPHLLIATQPSKSSISLLMHYLIFCLLYYLGTCL